MYKYKNVDDVEKRNKGCWEVFYLYDAQCAIDRLKNKIIYTQTTVPKGQGNKIKDRGNLMWISNDEVTYQDMKDIETLFIVCGIEWALKRIKVYPRPRLINRKHPQYSVWEYLDWS